MNYTQEPQKQEGYLLKKRKWPLKGWHKVRNKHSSLPLVAIKIKPLDLVSLSKQSIAGVFCCLNLMHCSILCFITKGYFSVL